VKKVAKPYLTGAAAWFVDEKLASGFASFSLNELTAKTGLSNVAARNQLLRLGDRIIRVTPRQQFFLIVTPEHRAIGAPPVDWWLDDYMRWLDRLYYLALQSAAAAHGSSQQAIQETQIITCKPQRDVVVGRIRVRFFMKASIQNSIIQPLSGTYAPMAISTPETTAFDLIRYAHSLGGIERMAETIAPMLQNMKPRDLRLVLDAENEIPTTQRLGYVLDAAGAENMAKVIREWLPVHLKLVPLSVHAGSVKEPVINEKWNVINNTGCTI
jgi:hypothetical protein